jgi:hypothetical protein
MADLFFSFNILTVFSAGLLGLLFAMEPGAGAWRWSKLVGAADNAGDGTFDVRRAG